MEKFEERAFQPAPNKPAFWVRYVDDTFVIWIHLEETLSRFPDHLNSVHPKIRFAMEKEACSQVAFLDVLVMMRDDRRLGHKVYWKPVHNDRHLHRDSNHHPRQTSVVMKTLGDRASRIYEPQYLGEDLKLLNIALQANEYSAKEVRSALRPTNNCRSSTEDERETLWRAFRHVTDRIERILESPR